MSVRQIYIGGDRIGLIDIDEIFEKVKELGIEDRGRLKDVLFEKIKSKNYVPPNMEDVYKEDLLEEYRVFIGELESRPGKQGVTEIRVYGAGCQRCERLDQMVMEIIAGLGTSVDYLYVTDERDISAAGIMGTPALTIDGKVAVMGNVPPRGRLEEIISGALKPDPST
jgi:small redox-active disulfide protein 2